MKRIALKRIAATLLVGAAASLAFADTQHVVKRGETIYGIAYRYGISPEAIVKKNPHANDGVRQGMVLTIPDGKQPQSQTKKKDEKKPVATTSQPKAEKQPKETKTTTQKAASATPVAPQAKSDKKIGDTYIVVDGDTFTSIASKAGMTVDDLTELNPFIDPDRLLPGMVLRLTDNAPLNVQKPSQAMRNINKSDVASELPAPVNDAALEVVEVKSPPINQTSDVTDEQTILVLLPFMTNEAIPSRQAQLYTDFYKGLLIAADTLRHESGAPIKIVALDTRNDASVISTILDGGQYDDVSVIIAPEEESQLRQVASFADKNDVYLLNVFNTKDETYRKNPHVLQGYINQQLMYEKAIDAAMNIFADYIPVILECENAKSEKSQFVDALCKKFGDKGVTPVNVAFSGTLQAEKLSQELQPDQKYVFIPKSGSLQVFNRISSAIHKLRKDDVDPERLQLFGYPDWTAFRGDPAETLHDLGATIYSRFFFDENSDEAKYAVPSFTKWYGTPMIEVVPYQGMLGFDTGCYLIRALRRNGGEFADDVDEGYAGFRGGQSTFRFSRQPGDEGFINDALYIIKFEPDNQYTITIL